MEKGNNCQEKNSAQEIMKLKVRQLGDCCILAVFVGAFAGCARCALALLLSRALAAGPFLLLLARHLAKLFCTCGSKNQVQYRE